MKLVCLSDLHFEFNEVMPDQARSVLKGGDVLVLAGDIVPIRALPRTKHLGKFLEVAVSRFGKVIAVSGNHEFYGGSLEEEPTLRNYYTEAGVVFLEKETVDVGGLKFFGANFWTDMNSDDPKTKEVAYSYMNDYRVIRDHSPSDAVKIHRSVVEKMGNPDVVISHFAPNNRSVNAKYRNEGLANYAYYSDINIPDSVKLWVHGHMHDACDYQIGNTRVVCNPRGYPHERSFKHYDFDANVTL